ncbi:hypothetical protein ACS0TY_019430 [Phlomoides rotata]
MLELMILAQIYLKNTMNLCVLPMKFAYIKWSNLIHILNMEALRLIEKVLSLTPFNGRN